MENSRFVLCKDEVDGVLESSRYARVCIQGHAHSGVNHNTPSKLTFTCLCSWDPIQVTSVKSLVQHGCYRTGKPHPLYVTVTEQVPSCVKGVTESIEGAINQWIQVNEWNKERQLAFLTPFVMSIHIYNNVAIKASQGRNLADGTYIYIQVL